MPGRPITDQQHRLYMTQRLKHTRNTAAAMAGISPSSGYRAEKDPRLPSERRRDRVHRGGKPDPLGELWEKDILPMLGSTPGLKAVTMLHELEHRYPDRDIRSARRTLERRIRLWKAEYGPEQEVIFRQEHPPGQQAQSDFFDAGDLRISIAGEPLAHRIYHFALVYSGWEHAEVVLGGESFTALACGLQNALWQLGGAPREHRTDSLSAAFANLDRDTREDQRERYRQLCAEYRMEPTRNNRGVAHENGSIESRHGHLKTRLDQALLLRASRDFDTVDDWRAFLARIVGQHNARRRDALRIEAEHLQPLPARRSCDYDEAVVTVTSSSGFVLRKVFYTVPSRLIGQSLKARIYDERIELYLATCLVVTLPRRRAPDRSTGRHAREVNYHHIIHNLRAKPQAFANLVYRDQLFPRSEYRSCWERLETALPKAEACRVIVQLLWLAHDQACEAELALHLAEILDAGALPDVAALQKRFQRAVSAPPAVPVLLPATASYDALLTEEIAA